MFLKDLDIKGVHEPGDNITVYKWERENRLTSIMLGNIFEYL